MDYSVIFIAIAVFLVVVLSLTFLLLFAKAKLMPSGKVKITINGDQTLEVDGGSTLLSTLSSQGIFLPSACGGGGTCVQCTCQVHSGGGSILPTEEPHFSRKLDLHLTERIEFGPKDEYARPFVLLLQIVPLMIEFLLVLVPQ